MRNPFDVIEARLSSIENLILDLKHQPKTEHSAGPAEQFLTIQEAAIFLNLKVPTMYDKVKKSELPVMKRGKRLYFSQTELTEYLKNGKKKTFAEIEAEAEAYLSNKKSAAL